MARYVSETEGKEKERLAEESKRYQQRLYDLRSAQLQDIEAAHETMAWEEFIRSQKSVDQPETIIPALDVLRRAVRHDSTVQQL